MKKIVVPRCAAIASTSFILPILSLALASVALSASMSVNAPLRSNQATPIGANPIWLGATGSYVYFTAQPPNASTPGSAALFRTDGTSDGTTQVAPIDGVGVLTSSKVGALFLSAGIKSYFLANTAATGQEIWVTDGTTAGTHHVDDIYPGGEELSPFLMGIVGTDLIFAESTSDNTMQLFRTDGTATGTVPLSNFASSQYGLLTDSGAVNGKFYAALASNLTCCQPDLWVTDGTPSGTIQIDSNEGFPFHLQPSSLRTFGNSLALLTNAENTGTELSLVDSTTNALTILDIAPGAGSGASDGSTIAAMDGFILYVRGDPNDGLHLYRSDGTLTGTALVTDLGPGVQVSQISPNIVVTRVGDRAIFQSENMQNGPQLWGSDGTAAGTAALIGTPIGGTPAFYVKPLIGVVGSHAYYGVYTGSTYQVVATDGTASGTHVLTAVGALDITGTDLVDTQVAGDDNLTFIYVYHRDSSSGTSKHLYAYAPQTNTVTHLTDTTLVDTSEKMLFLGAQLFFRGSDATHGEQPWVSDGTAAGTHILLMSVSNVAPVANDDSANSASGASVSIDVIANDMDSDGSIDATSVQIVSQPTHGVVSASQSGSVVYTPTSGYSGSDSFTYDVKDNQSAVSNVATVTVTVTAAAAPPSGSGSNGGSGGGGGSINLFDLLIFGSILILSNLRRATSSAPLRTPSAAAKCTIGMISEENDHTDNL